jgi:hypothetical protein
VPPAAGAICFARYDVPIASAELAERLRVERSVLIVPGEHFGFERHIRFGIGTGEAPLRAALDEVGALLSSIAAAPAAR